MAPLVLARALAAQGREGAIVNFLDARMVDCDAEHAAYHLSKRMLFTLTRMMAVELAPAVRVNSFDRLAHTNPLQRVGSAERVVDAVLYLLQASFVTGQVLFLDGGRRMTGSMYGC